MDAKKLQRTGIVGIVAAAVCCFTPLLVILLGAVGLSAAVAWLDLVLFPALAFFIALALFGYFKGRRNAHDSA